MLMARLIAAALPPIAPDPNGLPGGNQIVSILGGIMFYALISCAIGFLLGGGTWWGGTKTQHAGAVQLGRQAVTGAILGVILIGAMVAVLNWGFGFGVSVS